MFPTNNVLALLWWGTYTVLGVWAQRALPGVDFFAPGIIICLQKEGSLHTVWLTVIWILLIEGVGNIPFGYGLAWYGMLVGFYFAGQWLFAKKSFLFMGLLGIAMGCLHPVLIYGLGSLTNLVIPMKPVIIEGVIQAATFPIIWLAVNQLYPKRLRQDVKPL